MRSTPEELLERLSELKGGDREVDSLIWNAFVNPTGYYFKDEQDIIATEARRGRGFFTTIGFYTSSLDAITGLFHKLLPVWTYNLAWMPSDVPGESAVRCTLGGPGYISDDHMRDTFEETLDGGHDMLPIAACICLLKALAYLKAPVCPNCNGTHIRPTADGIGHHCECGPMSIAPARQEKSTW